MRTIHKKLIFNVVTATMFALSAVAGVANATTSHPANYTQQHTETRQGILGELVNRLSVDSGVKIFVSDSLLDRKVTLSLRGDNWSEKMESAFSGMNTIAVHDPAGDLYRLFVLNVGDSPVDLYSPGSSDELLWKLQEVSVEEANSVYQNARTDSIQNIDFSDLRSSQTHDRYRVTLPDGDATMVISRAYALDGGMTSVSGYLEEYGEWYSAHIVQWSDGYFGTINTPLGEYQIESANNKTYLVNMKRSGLHASPIDHEAMLPVDEYLNTAENDPGSHAAAAEEVLMDGSIGRYVDVLIFYTPGVRNKEARIRYLVDLSNSVLANSEANFRFRIVHLREVDYPEEASNNKAFGDLVNNLGLFEGVEKLRDEYGADLVSMVRPYNSDTHGNCGLAYILGRNNSLMNPRSAYSVASDGASGNYFCDHRTLVHEFGHNMGLAHAHDQTATGRHPYSHGHKVPGVFGTIMAYSSQRVNYFSTPLKTCNGQPCGVPEGEDFPADAVRTLNETSTFVANFREATDSDTYTTKPKDEVGGGGGGGGSLDFLWLSLLGFMLISKFRTSRIAK